MRIDLLLLEWCATPDVFGCELPIEWTVSGRADIGKLVSPLLFCTGCDLCQAHEKKFQDGPLTYPDHQNTEGNSYAKRGRIHLIQ
ncbi:MAG: hypothetical protein HOD58_06605 [Gammaproteobacteria bacterium]|jgi:hypothetical protein|nr:hypothetical protein [Gammaproteobacteria bacterium]MBT4605428.1 hypothetical protein [Thiotrichales bacterium]MBT4329577.1 hypothetical protein [Gammaproteobacteria bacterium]MBT5745425.1 hypothetical protein [Gammaproteobacteria bacterium]MBT6081002.1 hypothetical protein [Gammaproteobacteria bacterium]